MQCLHVFQDFAPVGECVMHAKVLVGHAHTKILGGGGNPILTQGKLIPKGRGKLVPGGGGGRKATLK